MDRMRGLQKDQSRWKTVSLSNVRWEGEREGGCVSVVGQEVISERSPVQPPAAYSATPSV